MRRGKSLAPIVVIGVLATLVFASSASALTTRAKVASFGTDGTSATSIFNAPGPLAFNQEAKRLYVLNKEPTVDRKIYGFDVAVGGTYTPLAGGFPIVVGPGGGEPDIVADNTTIPSATVGNIYYQSESSGTVFGFDSAAAALGAPFPIVPEAPKDLTGVGVDPSGYIWVGDWSAKKVRKYDPASGVEVGSVDTATIGSGRPAHPAFDSNGDMYLALYQGPLYKLTAASGYDPSLATLVASAATRAVTVDRTAHRVFAVHASKVSVYDTSGTLLYDFAVGISGANLGGVAVNESTDTAYVSDSGNDKIHVYSAAQNYGDATATAQPATGITGVSAVLNAKVTDNNVLPTDWRIEFSDNGGASWSTVGSGTTAGNQANVAVSATKSGLVASTAYQFRVVTSKGPGFTDVVSSPLQFKTASVPPLTSEVGAVDVEDTSARLVGTIDPSNSETGYVFEYGTTPALGSATTPLAIGGGTTPVVVSRVVSGLAKDTPYYFRLVATNLSGSTPSTLATFHTRAEAVPPAADRAYEQVSPVDKNFGNAVPATPTNLPAVEYVALDGQAMLFSSANAFGDPAGHLKSVKTQYVSRRDSDGWHTRRVVPNSCISDPNNVPEPLQFTAWLERQPAVSANIDHAVIQVGEYAGCETPPLDSAAPLPATNLYRENFNDDPISYDLLAPSFADPPGQQVIVSETGVYAGASDDFDHIFYGSTSEGGLFGVFNNLWEWDNGTLRLASVEPDGDPFTSRSSMVTAGVDRRSTSDAVNSVSADGSRFFFENPQNDNEAPPKDIYMREGGTATHMVSESECTTSCGSQDKMNRFNWASANGELATFRSNEKLVDSDNYQPIEFGFEFKPDLYAYRHSPNPTVEQNLFLLTQDNEPSDGNTVGFKRVLGVADDGSSVFFIAESQLVSGQPTAPGPKIYRWTWNAGSPELEYLATASNAPQVNEEDENWQRRVSRSGDTLMIEAKERVDPVADHDTDTDIYLWSEGPGWTCVSCQTPGDPSGGPSTTSRVGPRHIAGWSGTEKAAARELMTAFSDDAEHVFFLTQDALVPGDVNGPCAFDADVGYYPCSDIYEWHNGRLSLVSTGTGSSDLGLIGISESGNDVFFYSGERLVGWDQDNLLDVYDARVGGGLPEPPAQPAACEGESCRGQASSTPAGSGAGTAAFQGPGNPTTESSRKRCPKGKRKVRRAGKTRCIKPRTSRKQRKPNSNRSNDSNRRAGR